MACLPMNMSLAHKRAELHSIVGKLSLPEHLTASATARDSQRRKFELFNYLLSLFPRERYPIAESEKKMVLYNLRI